MDYHPSSTVPGISGRPGPANHLCRGRSKILSKSERKRGEEEKRGKEGKGEKEEKEEKGKEKGKDPHV